MKKIDQKGFDIVKISQALANDTRLQILDWLKNPKENFPPCEEFPFEVNEELGVCVSRIQKKSGLSQSTISNYIDQLERAQLLTSKREGRWTYIKRDEKRIEEYILYLSTHL